MKTRTIPALALLGLSLALAPASRASDLLPEIDSTLLRMHELDRPYRVRVEVREAEEPPPDGRLFGDLPAKTRLHSSYQATYDFCQEFDPYDDDDDEVSLARAREYLRSIEDMAPIQEAYRVTRRRSVDDLLQIWFRRGRGFEHVVCGEAGGRDPENRRLGGYHFWYLHYRYEREGRASYRGADYGRIPNALGMADPHIVTGELSWDPDGPGGHPPLPKRPRGGFTVGNSVAALLATGHVAFYGARRSPVEVNLNGRTYPWTFYRRWRDRASSVRSLWPRFVPEPR